MQQRPQQVASSINNFRLLVKPSYNKLRTENVMGVNGQDKSRNNHQVQGPEL